MTVRSAMSCLLSGKTITGAASARLHVDGRPYINFFGSGYLALGGLAEIRAPVLAALHAETPFAEPVPRALGACDPVFEGVEHAAAIALGAPACVYFASGYLLGRVALASLQREVGAVFLDAAAHYNLKDAAVLSECPRFEFAHADPESLRAALERNLRPGQRPLVVTDGVFATTGRLAPLRDYARAVAPYEGRLLVDESHAFGVVGEHGRGAAEYCGVEDIAIVGTTLSKALCAQGAVVACSRRTATQLRTAAPIRGANAGSPLSALAGTAALDYVSHHPEIRNTVASLTSLLRQALRKIGLDVIDSPAPIVSFSLTSKDEMLAVQRELWRRGIFVYHSTYIGAGPEGVLRCAVFRDHSASDIELLASTLAKV